MGVVIRPRKTAYTAVLPQVVSLPEGDVLAQGLAVAIRVVGDNLEYCACGAMPADYADAFFGFLLVDGVPGQLASVITGRGSIVSPLLEADDLTPEGAVFLSVVPGRVTPHPPHDVPDARVLRVGTALTTSTMILITDDSYWVPGN